MDTGAKLVLTNNFYQQFLKGEIEKNFNPCHCLIFSFPLSFQIPIKSKTCFRTTFNNSTSAFIFDKYETVSHEAFEQDSALPMAKLRTRVEMAHFLPKNKEVARIKDISQLNKASYEFLISHFHHLTNRLNNYIYAYRMLFEDSKAHLVSPAQYFNTHVEIISLPLWKCQISGPLIVNGIPAHYENIIFNMSDKQQSIVEALGMYMDQNPSPFISASHFFADARRYLYIGLTKETVLNLGMSSEALVNGIYTHIRRSSGLSEIEIQEELETIPFMQRIKKYISHSVGGNWDLNSKFKPAGKWKRNVYNLRNKVVHSGYHPNIEEAYEAFTSMIVFSDFIRERVRKSKAHLQSAHAELECIPPFFLEGEELPPNFDIS